MHRSRCFGGYHRLAGFNRDTAEALTEASSAVVRCIEDLTRSWMRLGQLSVQNGAAAARAMAGARSVQGLLDLQIDLSRSILDDVLAESLRLSELSKRTADEAIAPLQARYHAAFAHMVKGGAAA